MKNNNIEKTEFLKIVYFDEAAAQDYVDVTNGGRLDWSTQENKEKIAKIVAEIEAQAKSGFNILNYIKATFQGKVDASASAELTSAFDKTIKNTLLTDYIQAASKDEHVKKFENSGVYAPENSVTLYKMLSSYLTIVPTDRSILAILPEKEYQSYFENLMYRLILNNGSHRLDQTRSMSDMNFFTVISDSEKKRTAKEILCFIYLLNEKHVLAHLDGCSNVQSNLSKWCNDVKNKVGA